MRSERLFRWWRRLGLSRKILLLQVTIIVVTLGTGVGVSIVQARAKLDDESGQQSLAIARSVAAIPAVVHAFGKPHPAATIDPIAERIRKATGASFVVVADRSGIRYSHPNPAKIGTSLLHDPGENPAQVLAGKSVIATEHGSLGTSVRAKVPIYDDRGRIVGLVSVGLLQSKIGARLVSDLPVILIPALIGLALGIAGSLLLARLIKRQTFGLEPHEIAGLLEQREAMLHGIREGMVATDAATRVTLINDEAKRLLDLEAAAVGSRLRDVVPPGRLLDVLSGHVDGPDQLVLVADRVLVANRVPVSVRGRNVGAVVTLRDRTELEGLIRELQDVRGLADALRAQDHEYSNRLHVISGLIELGRHEEAISFITQSSHVHQALAESLIGRVGDPMLVALLLGKAAVAAERGIDIRVSPDTELPDEVAFARDLISVVGNLVDNALDSVASIRPSEGWIEVTIREDRNGILVQVHDSGPGVDPGLADEIFREGFTTKVATGVGRRGLGLALVGQAVRRRDGFVRVENVGGALFTVFLPYATGEPRPRTTEEAAVG